MALPDQNYSSVTALSAHKAPQSLALYFRNTNDNVLHLHVTGVHCLLQLSTYNIPFSFKCCYSFLTFLHLFSSRHRTYKIQMWHFQLRRLHLQWSVAQFVITLQNKRDRTETAQTRMNRIVRKTNYEVKNYFRSTRLSQKLDCHFICIIGITARYKKRDWMQYTEQWMHDWINKVSQSVNVMYRHKCIPNTRMFELTDFE